MSDFKRGDVLVSPSGTLAQVTEAVARDPRWKTAGWRVLRLNNGTGDGHGFTEFLADYIAGSWRKVEIGGDWTPAPMTGGALEERYVAERGVVRRELRRVATDPS